MRPTRKVFRLSTSGVAHHQRGTFPVDESAEVECARRAARFAAQDAAYRAALGLNPEDPLPGTIGRTFGGARYKPGEYTPQISGGRRRRTQGFDL